MLSKETLKEDFLPSKKWNSFLFTQLINTFWWTFVSASCNRSVRNGRHCCLLSIYSRRMASTKFLHHAVSYTSVYKDTWRLGKTGKKLTSLITKNCFRLSNGFADCVCVCQSVRHLWPIIVATHTRQDTNNQTVCQLKKRNLNFRNRSHFD